MRTTRCDNQLNRIVRQHPLYSQRLAEADIKLSVGSKGDSYDSALAEMITGLYKTELIHHQLLEPIGYIPPAEAEANYHWQLASQAVPV